jgi:uncharacterized protein
LEENLITEIPGRWDIPYLYSIGSTAGKFLSALAGKQLLATYCSQCNRAFVPPRSFCEECFVPLDQWRELSHTGVIEAATIVSESFPGMPKPPYALAYVRLDGADTALGNFLRGVDLDNLAIAREQMTIGTRVRVEFTDRPEGRITDFFYVLSN